MKKPLLRACVYFIASLTIYVFNFAQVNAGNLSTGKPEGTWENRCEDCNRPGGPGDVFNKDRTARIQTYSTAMNNANSAYSDAVVKARVALAKAYMNSIGDKEAQKDYDKAINAAATDWTKSENAAYNALLRGLRADYRKALTNRENEYRNARLTYRHHFHLSAKSKSTPFGGHEYDSVSGCFIHPRVQEGQGWRIEWEVADHNVYNPDAHHLSGAFHKKSVTPADGDKYVGFYYYFEGKGPDYRPGGATRTADGDPWCAFKFSEKTCSTLARSDMGGVSDEQLATCEVLLSKVGFKRAKTPE